MQELRASPVKFDRIAYRIDPKQFEGRQLLYLSTPTSCKEIRDKIFDHQEFMESFAGDPSLARLLEGVNTQMAAAFVSNLFDLGLKDKDLPVDTRFLRVLLEQIAERGSTSPAPYRSPWGTLFSFGERRAPTRATSSPTTRACSSSWSSRRRATRAASSATRTRSRPSAAPSRTCAPEFPTVQAGVTGGPALSNDEMTAAFHDSSDRHRLAFALTLLVMSSPSCRVGKPVADADRAGDEPRLVDGRRHARPSAT